MRNCSRLVDAALCSGFIGEQRMRLGEKCSSDAVPRTLIGRGLVGLAGRTVRVPIAARPARPTLGEVSVLVLRSTGNWRASNTTGRCCCEMLYCARRWARCSRRRCAAWWTDSAALQPRRRWQQSIASTPSNLLCPERKFANPGEAPASGP